MLMFIIPVLFIFVNGEFPQGCTVTQVSINCQRRVNLVTEREFPGIEVIEIAYMKVFNAAPQNFPDLKRLIIKETTVSCEL